MRIAALLTDAYGGRGGIAKVNRDLLAALAGHERTDEIVALPRRIDVGYDGIPDKVTFRTGAAAGRSAYLRETARCAAIGGLGLVVCGHVNLAPLARVIAAVRRVPALMVIHGMEAWTATGRAWTDRAAAGMPAVLAVSRFTLDRYLGWAHPSATFVVPNAVDLSRFAPGPKSADMEERWGLRGKLVLLTLGRLEATERAKGFDQMLAILPRLAEERPEVVYVIAGEGTDRPRLEDEVRRRGLTGRVVFTGEIPEERKADLYRTADLYVMPSRLEGFGLVYLEALASGRPVVGSAIDGSREALLDGKLGELVDPDRPDDILRGIRAAFARPKGVVPSELSGFSIDAYRRRIHDVVDAVAGGRGGR
jgi:glycosyltransferase involved in cell wall biosynthesis